MRHPGCMVAPQCACYSRSAPGEGWQPDLMIAWPMVVNARRCNHVVMARHTITWSHNCTTAAALLLLCARRRCDAPLWEAFHRLLVDASLHRIFEPPLRPPARAVGTCTTCRRQRGDRSWRRSSSINRCRTGIDRGVLDRHDTQTDSSGDRGG
jgi:hypothetical protein